MIEIELLNPVIKDDTPIYDGPVNVVPSTESQTLETAGKKLESNVTIEATPLESKTFDVTENGQYSVTPDEAVGLSAVEVNVDVQPELQTKSVEYNANGQYSVTADEGYDGLSEVNVKVYIKEVEVPENDVEFIDYDGRIVYSYTKNEFLSLTELPANPQHEGLIAQGWNWTLSDAKEYVTDCDGLVIGQMYITDDGKTRIYIILNEAQLSLTLSICPNGTAHIEWGDGTSDDVTGTSITTRKDTPHTYSAAGNYVISISISSGGGLGLVGGAYNTTGHTIWDGVNYNNLAANVNYANAVYKIELGDAITITSFCFVNYCNLEKISIPKNTAFNGQTFYSAKGLRCVVFPDTVTNLSAELFYHAESLMRVSLPKNASFNAYFFAFTESLKKLFLPLGATTTQSQVTYNDYSLRIVVLPKTITSIFAGSFRESYIGEFVIGGTPTIANTAIELQYCKMLRFTSETPPVLSGSNSLSGIRTDCKIYVPSGSLAAYTSATNYPNPATYTYVEY